MSTPKDIQKIVADAKAFAAPHDLAELTRIAKSLQPALNEIARSVSPLAKVMKEMDAQQDLLRRAGISALGADAFDRLHGVFGIQGDFHRVLEQYHSRFTIPDYSGIQALAAGINGGPMAEMLARYRTTSDEIAKSLAGLRSPWLDDLDLGRSFAGIGEITAMGKFLSLNSAFSDEAAAALRESLGDFRDPITFTPNIYDNLAARVEFYEEHGFNPALTDFPVDTFDEAVANAGLVTPPTLVDMFGNPITVSEEDEDGVARTTEAHGWIVALESQLRRFIHGALMAVAGVNWPKHRAHKDVYDKWREKKEADKQKGRTGHVLIEYADFTDYADLICREDNWQVFGPFFQRKEYVRESFQRLYPLRLATGHSRLLSSEDMLYLFVETKRLGDCFKKN